MLELKFDISKEHLAAQAGMSEERRLQLDGLIKCAICENDLIADSLTEVAKLCNSVEELVVCAFFMGRREGVCRVTSGEE